MVSGRRTFKLFFWAVLGLTGLMAGGCHSTPEHSSKKKDTEIATIRVHVEVDMPSDRSQVIEIPREDPIKFNVEKAPFLTEANIRGARVYDTLGGFALRLQFDRQGALLLEQYSGGNRGRHLAIMSQFANATNNKVPVQRWLAAPKIYQRIADGVIAFTPDASREEAYQIAVGLSNVAAKHEKQSFFPTP